MKKKWYQKNITVIISLILFFPIGLFLMWKYTEWKRLTKIIVTVALALFFISLPSSDTNTSSQSSTEVTAEAESTESTGEESNEVQIEESATPDTTEVVETAEVTETPVEDPIAAINGEVDGFEDSNVEPSSEETEEFKSHKVYDSSKIGECITYAKECVKNNIKTPGSAKFPKTILEPDAYTVVTCPSTTKDMDGYIITGYFDAQNGFGALVRADFMVQLEMNDKQWKSVDVIITER